MILAIDGPAGSGKSTIARLVAARLGFAYLDTGAMYRAVTVRAVNNDLDVHDEQSVAEIAQNAPITFGYTPGNPIPTEVFIDGEDVTYDIRTAQTDLYVSPVSALPAVRLALTDQQRVLGAERDTVMEGRDIGTVVFPHAELKIFLTASSEERAHRRALQNVERGVQPVDEAAVHADLLRRDAADSSRDVAPLVAASDAVTVDTTNMNIEQVVEHIVELVEAKKTELEATSAQKLFEATSAQKSLEPSGETL
ncbi:MAG: (d)CMP kinase [Coriobacteriia bacterium]|nr:(d)CMP kinase [Coriobacteriia bacterium]